MFHSDIKKLAKENDNFRKVLCTGEHSQVVVMSIPVGGDIGQETHPDTDQILYLVEGQAQAILNDQSSPFTEDELVYVAAGTKHNFKNTGDKPLKLFTIYSPPEHADDTVHKTKEDAQRDKSDIPYSDQNSGDHDMR